MAKTIDVFGVDSWEKDVAEWRQGVDMKKLMLVVVAAMGMNAALACGVVAAIGMDAGHTKSTRLGEGNRLNATMVSRTSAQEEDVPVIEDGVWKKCPGGLFGKKFGEVLKDRIVLWTDKKRQERYVSFQPEKRFRTFSSFRQIVDPRTRIVYGLSCSARFSDKAAAQKELADVKELFRQKFPKGYWIGSRLQVGYGADGEGGVLGPFWTVELELTVPQSKGQIQAEYEVTIRAIDKHFHPPSQPKPTPMSSDLDAL